MDAGRRRGGDIGCSESHAVGLLGANSHIVYDDQSKNALLIDLGGDYDMIVVGEYTDFRYPTLLGFVRWANINTFWIGGPKWTTEEIENTIYAAIEEQDEAKAKEMLGQVEQLMKDECLVSNICPEMHAGIVAADLKGYTTIERGFIDPTNFYK